MTTTNKPNAVFWIIGIIALLWNLMGLLNFSVSTFMPDMLAESYSAEELGLMNSLPSWYAILFGISVITGVLGCILLLMRKKSAVMIFLISLVSVLIQMGYWLFATDVMEVMGAAGALTMPLLVILIALILYFYSKAAAKKGWLS